MNWIQLKVVKYLLILCRYEHQYTGFDSKIGLKNIFYYGHKRKTSNKSINLSALIGTQNTQVIYWKTLNGDTYYNPPCTLSVNTEMQNVCVFIFQLSVMPL